MDKFNCKLVELAKLRMISMSWISCTVSSMSRLSRIVSRMRWIRCGDEFDEFDKFYCKFDELAKLRMSFMS